MEEAARNEEQFMKVLAAMDPDLYIIKTTLQHTGINPKIVPRILKSLAKLIYGDGYGSVEIAMHQRKITTIFSKETDKVNLDAAS